MTDDIPSSSDLHIAYVPGVTPGKWIRRWEERHPDITLHAVGIAEADQLDVLWSNTAQMCFVRLADRPEGLHLIPLYDELPVVVASRDHEIAAFEEVSVADLAGENFLPTEPADIRDAVELAGAGVGVVIMPMSLARLYHRRDVIYRPVTGVEGTQISLAWRQDASNEAIEEFIGIVRGRTANSSRQPSVRQAQRDSATGVKRTDQQARPRKAKAPHRGGGRASGPRRRRR